MMSNDKWLVVRKPSTGEIITTSANQIVQLKFHGPPKMLYYIHQTPLSSCSVEWGSGDETTSHPDCLDRLTKHYSQLVEGWFLARKVAWALSVCVCSKLPHILGYPVLATL